MKPTTHAAADVSPDYDITSIRKDFPILSSTVHGKPLVYLDNAATTHKPVAVLDTIEKYYRTQNSNIHRGVHYLSQMATAEYERDRETVRKFINASKAKEIIFTRGATEGINLVASSYGSKFIKEGDEIIITGMEHHSNIVPWQMLCERNDCSLKVIPLTDSGEIEISELKKLITNRTKLISVVHASNSLGTINPIKEIISIAHNQGINVLVDAAQSIQHLPVDVRELDCDFLVFSGHKIYGPTGTGILYGKEHLLNAMPPYQGGGDMILSVTFEKTTFNELPYKFEAGTPNIAGGIALGAALEYVSNIGIKKISSYEHWLTNYTVQALNALPKLKMIGEAGDRVGSISFVLEGIHPHDIGTILDFDGIAIRTGHLCTQPVMHRYGIPATARLSLGLYNTKEEIDFFVKSLHKVFEVFA
ncbi:MAG: cysteine desulfurase [Ignavibacteriales bacterium]|nr:cysteine desulfurase [Ignavibacteriales bacterium]